MTLAVVTLEGPIDQVIGLVVFWMLVAFGMGFFVGAVFGFGRGFADGKRRGGRNHDRRPDA